MTHAVVVPAYAHDALDELDGACHQILLSVDSDVNLEGSYDRQWLIVTREQVAIVRSPTNPRESVKASARTVLRLSWQELLEFRTRAGVGSGLLQARTADGWVDLLRFSNALASRFHKVSRKLEKLRECGDQEGEADSTFDPPRCHGCDLRLEHAQDDCPRCVQKGHILRRVSDMLRPHLQGALILCGLTVVGVCAELIPPKLQQYMVDEILGQQTGVAVSVDFTTALLVVVLSLMATRLVLSAVAVVKGRVATMIGTGLTTSLREQMVQKLQKLAVVYYDRHQVGSTLSRVAHDSEVLHGLMHQLTGGFLLQMVQLVAVGAMLLWMNPKLAMYTLIPVPLVFLGSWVFWQKVYPKHFRLRDASAKQWSVLNGMLSGIRVVKAFAQEDREYERFQRANNRLRQWRLWVDFTNDRYAAAMSLVFSMGGLIVWYVGGRDVIGREMTLGELIAFLAYLAMFYAPLSALSNFTTWLTSFLSGSKRVLELLDAPMTIPEAHNPQPWEEVKGEVVFDQVTFGYDRNQPVLQDISFKIRPGEMIGIVGRSGSGKTTMVNLLGRFYDVQEGKILIDGIDIRELSSHQLRERMGIVFQDSFLFRGTIWKNLSYGRPQATIEQCLEAAKAAGAHDFICRQQLAYETLLGEHGAGLSGGERQRLSIVRTLLYDPKVLILDEATSNIDAESERSIQKALDRLVKGRTTLAIAHRLSTLRNADRIFVFDKGKIAESGTHEELLSSAGIYARMVRIQTQVTKTPHVDHLLAAMEEGTSEAQPCQAQLSQAQLSQAKAVIDPAQTKADEKCSSQISPTQRDEAQRDETQRDETQRDETQRDETRIRWLTPQDVEFTEGQYGQLIVKHSDGDNTTVGGVFVVRAFPASHSEQYLSVRGWNDNGDEVEVGVIHDLAEWSMDEQELIRLSLGKRYLLRNIQRVLKVDLRHGFLEFEVETDGCPQKFLLRWSASQAIDYGEDGKLLIDTEENRYLVESVSKLSASDRERFEQYVYW